MVYVHGYYTTVDQAWVDHKLPEQFAACQQNAIFAAVSAPSSANTSVSWDSLSGVRAEVERLTGIAWAGPTVLVGHSGAYRTLARWLASGGEADQVTLLDALYGNVGVFERWIAADVAYHTMNLVTCSEGVPRANADAMVRRLERTRTMASSGAIVRRQGVPPGYEDLSPVERRAKLLYIVANQTHMGLVRSGAVVPVALRRSPLRVIAAPHAPEGGRV